MNPLIFCQTLAAVTIIGATEVAPGWIQVDYLNDDHRIDFLVIPKKEYKVCYPDS